MLKIAVFDYGYGGELLADKLHDTLPLVEIIRIISWRESEAFYKNSRRTRELMEKYLKPYINRVDLIIIANHLLSVNHLNYFKRKYKTQKFIGLNFTTVSEIRKRQLLFITPIPAFKISAYRNYFLHFKKRITAVCLKEWPKLIDDGELNVETIKSTMIPYVRSANRPDGIILACSQFADIEDTLRSVFGCTIKIYDGFNDVINRASRILKLRGGTGRKAK